MKAALGLLVALLALLAVTSRTLRGVEAPADPAERKIAEAQRYLYYVVTRDEGLELRLTGQERELHIVSHARLPGAPPFDPARQLVYGLRVSVVAGGAEVWTRELYTRSRQSKARREGGLWLDENAFSLERAVEVTDDRLTVVRLPAELPAASRLRLRLVGAETDEALVRVYEKVPRPEARVELRLRSLAPGEREELAAALSFTPWDRLDAVERAARLREHRVRLSAEGREGEGFRTRALFVTGFRLPLDEEAPHATPLGTLVTPARAAAVNVVGPVELRVALARGPAVDPSLLPAQLELRWTGEGGQPPTTVIPVPPAPTTVALPLEIPAGLHTLELRTDARDGVQVALTAPAGSAAQLGVPAAPGTEETLAPHELLLGGVLLGPDTPPLVLSVPGDDLLLRVLRVDARILPTAAPPEAPVAGAVTVETFDAAGKRLTRQLVQLGSQVSRFEELRAPASPPRVVAEPASFRLIAPAGARRVEVRPAQPTFLRAHALATLAPDPDALDAPFDAVVLARTTWRYAPHDERSWVPVAPHNRAALAPHEARLAAQVRLEPAPAPAATGSGVAQSLAPEGQPERQVVLERGDGAAWGAGQHTALRLGKAQKIQFAGGAPPRLLYWVLGPPEVNLGRDVTVRLDGRALAVLPVATSRSTWELPPVGAGTHTVEVTSDAPNLRLLLDQPPAGGGEVVALRSVYRAGAPLTVRVDKPGAAPTALNLVVYAPSRDGDLGARFRVRVDGGAPRRAEGVALAALTPGTRVYTLPPADRAAILGFADGGDRTVYHPRLIAVGLGDDVGAGAHTVTIEPLGRAERTWMRMFVMTSSKREPERAIQWRLAPPRGGE